MTTIVILFALGILLLTFEVVVPGGVLGVLGGLAMLGGCALAFYEFGAGGGGLATAIALGCLGIGLFVEFRILPRTRFGRKLFLSRTLEAKSQPAPAEATVIGRTGEALTTMAPSGYVSIEGRRYEAVSQSGLIAKGAKVRIVGMSNFHLIVTQA